MSSMSNINTPAEIAQAVVNACKIKVKLSWRPMFILGILAGAYIAFGAELATLISTGVADKVGLGFAKFLAGSVFSVGLMLVVIGGAELFTGNNLIFTGFIMGEVGWVEMMRNWIIVYFGNLAGSLLMVYIMTHSGLVDGAVGVTALKIASAKVSLPWDQAFFRGIGCNWLVCLAVWLAFGAKDVVGKIFAVYFPIMAFVASGFEHCVANMYFIPMGIALKANAAVVAASEIAPEQLANLTWRGFAINNLVPVTLGNILGGAVFVGAVYALAYLKGKPVCKLEPASK
ncbi:MAG: formate/nitrite transporter family protein [Pseudomonadota bacterium]